MKNFILITPFLAIIVILMFFLQHHLVAALSPIQQKVALFQFKQSLNITTPTDCIYYDYFYISYPVFYRIPSYPKTKNWSMSSDHCTWEGVGCEQETGDVIGLDLSCSQLEGAILPNSTLFQLSHLRFLNLSNNDFSRSSHFPQEFGFFAKGLTHLNLSNTRFTGRVPSGISHLYKLVSLDLSDYPGEVKLENEAFKSILHNLTQLRVLNLNWVNIDSVLPVNLSTSLRVLSLIDTGIHGVLPQQVFHLPNIEVLALGSNDGLQAVLPKCKWGSSGTLQHLFLFGIEIYGGIPDSIGFLESLARLELECCNLSWPIPRSIGNLDQLTYLGLGLNNLSGPIPTLSTNLTKLRYLDLSLNNDGLELEDVVFKSILQNLTQLRVLDLGGVNISSVLPVNLSTSLRVLYLTYTGLHGVLPQEVFHLPNMEILALGGAFMEDEETGLQAVLPKGKWGSSGTLQDLLLLEIDIYGGMPDSIGFLNSLASLELHSCNLSGPIPKSLGNLRQLTYLDLGYNNLNGPIPKPLANLTNLTYLSLSYNNFTGPFISSIAHFKGLIYLHLENNGFTGLLPTRLFNLPSLEVLDLSNNGFTGQLYDFNSTKSQLTLTYLYNNLLYGPIPQSFSQLVKLNYLDLSSNNFSGFLDVKVFSRLKSLERLDLSHNTLLSVRSSNTTTIPPKLEHLDLSSCNMKEFPYFSRDAEISLNWVDLSNNEIEGEIPHWIGSVGEYLNISHNRLTGGLEQLPWNNINFLDLQSNNLNGSLPTMICDSDHLVVLNLSNNTLSGVLPICRTELRSLSVLDLRMNDIQGSLPSTLSNFRNLNSLNLHGNKLEGRFPSSFAEFDKLETLDLGSNQINDTFPQCLEALPNLQVLVLRSNKFHGLMNMSTEIQHPFPSLRILDISYNEFSGSLPAMYFKNFKAMMNGHMNETKPIYMGDDFYSDSTSLVIKGLEIEFTRILTVFTTIDVSMNNFEGEIGVYIGNLVSLRYLNLSNNHLTGHIPLEVGKLSMLESLDLSGNQLEGEIPPQLSSIYTLARLNLSFNQPSGHIPQGSQFNTFNNDSYVGNIALCGFPLSKECENDFKTQKEGANDDYFFSGFTWEAVVIGYGCGVVPAFITGNLMLLAGKPKWFAGIIARELGFKIRRMEIKVR